MMPFGGLRVLACSGQGLLGQSEELDKLLSKVLKDEMKEGIVAKIQDDVVIGGIDQREAAHHYTRVIYKLYLANLKVEPNKVHCFPESCDLAGWIWRKGDSSKYLHTGRILSSIQRKRTSPRSNTSAVSSDSTKLSIWLLQPSLECWLPWKKL